MHTHINIYSFLRTRIFSYITTVVVTCRKFIIDAVHLSNALSIFQFCQFDNNDQDSILFSSISGSDTTFSWHIISLFLSRRTLQPAFYDIDIFKENRPVFTLFFWVFLIDCSSLGGSSDFLLFNSGYVCLDNIPIKMMYFQGITSGCIQHFSAHHY